MRDMERQGAPDFPYLFSWAHGGHAIDFIEHYCRHWKGEFAGEPVKLSLWQKFVVGSLFGWVHVGTGYRRFRSGYVEVPRKNGKTTLAAGIALYLTGPDGEPGAEVYSAATKLDQAKIVWTDACRMIRKDRELRKCYQIFKTGNSIVMEATESRFVPLGADEHSLDGLNAHGIIIDELHKHKTRQVLDVLDTARGARRQPLALIITTAGDSKSQACRDEHDRAMRTLDGIAGEETLFAYIAAIDPKRLDDDTWMEPEAWAEANPNIGVSVKMDYLKEQAEAARTNPPRRQAFQRYHLNIWTGAHSSWLDPVEWDNCRGSMDADKLAKWLEGRECITALDLSTKVDLTAVVHVFPPLDPNGEGDARKWFCVPRFFIPEMNAESREKIDRVPYRHWRDMGRITMTSGNVIDFNAVKKQVLDDRERFHIREIVADKWLSAHILRELADDGFETAEFGQSLRYFAAPCFELEAMLKGGTFEHGGHEVLTWNARNVTVYTDANGNMRPIKPKGGKAQRIDGIVCLLMGIGRGMAEREDETESVYARTDSVFLD